MQLPLHSPEANLHSFAHILLHVESQCSLERTFKDHPTTHFKRWKLRWKFIAGLTFVHRFWCSRALFTHLFWFGLNKLIHL